jgi:hypothetical protein
MLFGKSRGRSPFVDPGAFDLNLKKQAQLAPQTLAELRRHGVTSEATMRLEFFFYANSRPNADALNTRLTSLGYQSSANRNAHDRHLFVVNGWSTPLQMDEPNVVRWTQEMCRVGLEYDCEFDGWGTLLDQSKIPSPNVDQRPSGA